MESCNTYKHYSKMATNYKYPHCNPSTKPTKVLKHDKLDMSFSTAACRQFIHGLYTETMGAIMTVREIDHIHASLSRRY